MQTEKNKTILVFYVDVRMIEGEEIEEFISKISTRVYSQLIDTQSIFIPVYGETRIECINPIYITDSELIKKHERLMAELHEHLKNQIDEQR
jgi:hypothetical protein